MKRLLYIVVISTIGLFAAACSNKYNDTIADYIRNRQTGANNMDIEVKVNETNELRKITVRDSINYINAKTKSDLDEQIRSAEAQLATFQQGVVNMGGNLASRPVMDAYTAQLVGAQRTIDSLRSLDIQPTRLYDSREPDDELAVIVDAKYTITNNTTKQKEEARRNFILSPDGKICYGVIDNVEITINQ